MGVQQKIADDKPGPFCLSKVDFPIGNEEYQDREGPPSTMILWTFTNSNVNAALNLNFQNTFSVYCTCNP